ncbi:MAG: DUF642 domain-containing protein [Phycisphaerales bacterium]|nr:DUF642 domain-containing protein [Phycisphaerales bacterium]
MEFLRYRLSASVCLLICWIHPALGVAGDDIGLGRGATPQFVNHSFETPLVPGNGVWWSSPTEFPGWNVLTDIATTFNLHGSIWASQDENQHIEFDNSGATLEQTLTGFDVGTEYAVVFGLTGNPDRERVYRVRCDVLDSVAVVASGEFEASSIGSTRPTIMWKDHAVEFAATESSLTIRFTRTDTTGSGYGPDMDNVRMVRSCDADFTYDEVLDVFDVFAFLDAYAAHDPRADFTGEGIFDIFDVFGFLDTFATGCP